MRLRSAALVVLLAPAPALATPYSALCGDGPCTIRLDASGIDGPSGFIPAGRITQWFSDSEERRGKGVGNAVAGAGNLLMTSAAYAAPLALGSTYVAAPVGLVSGLVRGMFSGIRSGDSADLSFNVVGYDPSGQKIIHQFRFVNPKPAGRVRAALPLVSGLAMGQTRSPDALLPDRLDSIDPAAAPFQDPASVPAPAPAMATSGGWERYLQDRGLVDWAVANPHLADQLRQSLFQLRPQSGYGR
ncbi:hypothetical protein KBZ18_13990 [Synechococcus sp. Cruz-9H2]|nr:hypothetical protein [Synechococcus sp. Cruz-9H2]MCP9871445.1 hypothetical protein [Synechococcus sp. Cruz-7B9]